MWPCWANTFFCAGVLRYSTTTALSGRASRRQVAIGNALKAVEKFSPQQSRAIELGFFGGPTQFEIAEVLNDHVATAWQIRPLFRSPIRAFSHLFDHLLPVAAHP
jgi:hypothetical protein